MATREDIVKASIHGTLTFFFLSVWGACAKAAAVDISSLAINFIAFLTALVLLIPLLIVKKVSLKTKRLPLLLSRGLSGIISALLYTLALKYIPLMNATTLLNTAPLFIPLICWLFLQGHIQKTTWWALVLGFIGVVIVVKPNALIFEQVQNFIGLGSGIVFAIASLCMRKAVETEPPLRIMFYFFLIGTLCTTPVLFFEKESFLSTGVFYAILAGVLLIVMQLFFAKAYQYGDAAKVGVFQYTSVLFAGLLDWLIWDTIPPLSDIGGVACVAIAGTLIILTRKKHHHAS